MARDWRSVRKQQLASTSPVAPSPTSETTMDPSNPTDTPLTDEELAAAAAEIEAGTATEAAPTTQETAPPVAETPAATKQRMKELTARELASLRRSERLQGRQAAMDVLSRKAQELGYASVDEMLAAAPKKVPVAPPPVAPEAQPSAKSSQRLKELEDIAARAERKLKAKAMEVANLRTEMELAKTARKTGIVDEDYAVHLLRQRINSMSADQVSKLDPVKFFEGLRNTHGYLFGTAAPVTQTPASTSPAGKPAPKTPAAAEVQQEAAAAGEVDVTKLSQADYEAYLRAKGVRNPRFLS